jgi:hypothetical protein
MNSPGGEHVSHADMGYVMLRHLGFILDELSAQGLDVWTDDERGWWWRWRGTSLQAERRLWALGETLVDAMIARYPTAFGGQWPRDVDTCFETTR